MKAGPVTLQVPTDGSAGWLNVVPWLNQGPARRYYASGSNLPVVAGTETCPTGTYTWNVRPHQFLETGDPYADGGVPPDGILQGTWSSDEHAGGARDVTYSWRLVPDP